MAAEHVLSEMLPGDLWNEISRGRNKLSNPRTVILANRLVNFVAFLQST